MSDQPTNVTGPNINIRYEDSQGLTVFRTWGLVEALRIYEQLEKVFNARDTLTEKLSTDPLLNPEPTAPQGQVQLGYSETELAALAGPPGPELPGRTFDEVLKVPASAWPTNSVRVGVLESPRPDNVALDEKHPGRLRITLGDQCVAVDCANHGMLTEYSDESAEFFLQGRKLRLSVDVTIGQTDATDI